MIEGNREDDLSIGASASDGENGVRVCIEVAIVLVGTVGGREDIDERRGGGLDDFFNVSQRCRGKSEVAEMLLTLEGLFLLLSSSGHLWWYCLTISGACTLLIGSHVLSLAG